MFWNICSAFWNMTWTRQPQYVKDWQYVKIKKYRLTLSNFKYVSRWEALLSATPFQILALVNQRGILFLEFLPTVRIWRKVLFCFYAKSWNSYVSAARGMLKILFMICKDDCCTSFTNCKVCEEQTVLTVLKAQWLNPFKLQWERLGGGRLGGGRALSTINTTRASWQVATNSMRSSSAWR